MVPPSAASEAAEKGESKAAGLGALYATLPQAMRNSWVSAWFELTSASSTATDVAWSISLRGLLGTGNLSFSTGFAQAAPSGSASSPPAATTKATSEVVVDGPAAGKKESVQIHAACGPCGIDLSARKRAKPKQRRKRTLRWQRPQAELDRLFLHKKNAKQHRSSLHLSNMFSHHCRSEMQVPATVPGAAPATAASLATEA